MRRILLAAAMLQGTVGQSPCISKMTELATAASTGVPADDAKRFGLLVLSSAGSLPYDAGKYTECLAQEGTRYFLVKYDATMGGKDVGPVGIGLCLLSEPSCNHEDAAAVINSSIGGALVPSTRLVDIKDASLQVTSPELDLQGWKWDSHISACFLVLLLLLVFAATWVNQCYTRPTSNGVRATNGSSPCSNGEPLIGSPPLTRGTRWAQSGLLQAFSLTGSTGTLVKLVELPQYKPTDCLNGMRVLSMWWIIMGHTFLMPEGVMGYMNPQDIVHSGLNMNTADNNTLFFFVVSAQAGVDSFFFLSGFLLSLLTMRELQATRNRFKFLHALVLRYLRLTPSLAFVMLLYYKIWPHLAAGPFAPTFQDSIYRRCDQSWWSELTYTLNFIPFDSDKVCMGWTWYLGDDMIFYIISIALLPLYHRSKVAGCACVLLLTLASFVVTIYLVVAHHLSIDAFDYHYAEYSYYAYSKPYTRIPAFFVGIVSAWLLLELERRGYTRGQQPRSPQAKNIAFAVALGCLGVLLFLTFIVATDHGADANNWSDATSAVYITFGRPLWACCLAVITLLCYYDYLPILNGFLSHPFWMPLARLCYGAYLVHPLVIKLAAGVAQQYYYFSGTDIFYRYVGNVLCAFSGATVVWCLIERPVMTLTTAALKRSSSAEKPPPSPPATEPPSGGIRGEISRQGAA